MPVITRLSQETFTNTPGQLEGEAAKAAGDSVADFDRNIQE